MHLKIEGPAAGDAANGANVKAAAITGKQYPFCPRGATSFTRVSTAALRVVHLVARRGVAAEEAAMPARLIDWEGRA